MLLEKIIHKKATKVLSLAINKLSNFKILFIIQYFDAKCCVQKLYLNFQCGTMVFSHVSLEIFFLLHTREYILISQLLLLETIALLWIRCNLNVQLKMWFNQYNDHKHQNRWMDVKFRSKHRHTIEIRMLMNLI